MRPELPGLIISMQDEALYGERVLRDRGGGYIMKQAGLELIIQAVRKVLGGGTYVSERIFDLIIDRLAGRRASTGTSAVSKLTDREFEVRCLLGERKAAHDLADHLRLSIKTIDTQSVQLREKLSLKNNTQLIHYAALGTAGQM